MSAEYQSNLGDNVQLLIKITPGIESEVEMLINKAQARLLIRKLKAALRKNSDLCEPIIDLDQLITVREPYNEDHDRKFVKGVSGRLTLDNY